MTHPVSKEELLCAMKGLIHLCVREHGLEKTEECVRSSLGCPKSSGAVSSKDEVTELKQSFQQPQKFSFSRVARWADQSDDEE